MLIQTKGINGFSMTFVRNSTYYDYCNNMTQPINSYNIIAASYIHWPHAYRQCQKYTESRGKAINEQ